MPAVTRVTDECTGHGCFPPRLAIEGSPNVFVNGLAVNRLADHWETHSCVTSHNGQTLEGSPTVFINGKAACRIGDPITCGSVSAQGSPDTFFG